MKQEIHFVTGKGGVGKSVFAAALALKKSQEGKKVLLVELGEQRRDIGVTPTAMLACRSQADVGGIADGELAAALALRVDELPSLLPRGQHAQEQPVAIADEILFARGPGSLYRLDVEQCASHEPSM